MEYQAMGRFFFFFGTHESNLSVCVVVHDTEAENKKTEKGKRGRNPKKTQEPRISFEFSAF
jgi:hypothetical protein